MQRKPIDAFLETIFIHLLPFFALRSACRVAGVDLAKPTSTRIHAGTDPWILCAGFGRLIFGWVKGWVSPRPSSEIPVNKHFLHGLISFVSDKCE